MTTEQNTTSNMPIKSDGVQTSIQNVPRALVEILVEGEEVNKPEIKRVLDILQAQINKTKNNERVRIFFYITDSEKTKLDRIHFLKENMSCKYYILMDLEANGFSVKSDFIKEVINAIKKTESGIEQMKKLGVIINPKKPS